MMAIHKIVSLNYITSGSNRSFVNVDTVLDYELFRPITILRHEDIIPTSLSGSIVSTALSVLSADIVLEHKPGGWYKTEFLAKEGSSTSAAMAKEKDIEAILLNEIQKYYYEISSASREYIRIYPPGTDSDTISKIEEFNRKRRHVNRTFVMDVDLARRSSDPSQDGIDSGINNIKEFSNSYTVYPMYDMVDVHVKSAERTGRCNLLAFDAQVTKKREDAYLPQISKDPVGYCQIQSDAYMLTERTKLGAGTFQSSLRAKRLHTDISHHYTVQIDSENTRTYLYGIDENGVIDITHPPVVGLDGVQYNYITEFPQSEIHAGYYQGNEYGYMFKGKNPLDSLYDMNLSIQLSGDTGRITLDKCRDYAGIGQFADTLYFKFYDGIEYQGISAVKDKFVEMRQVGANMKWPIVPYQKIECAYINKFSSASMHKTGFFSVKMMNSDLMNFEGYTPESDKDKKAKVFYGQIMKDIRGAVREIAESMQPAYTQFYDIMFDG